MSRRKESATPDSIELATYKEQTETSVNTWATEWTLRLKAVHVAQVMVGYAGGGDDGSIDSITLFKRENGELVEFDPEIPGRFRTVPSLWRADDGTNQEDTLEKLFYGLLDVRGFEVNNAGSQGSFVWNLEDDMLVHEHGSNFYDAESNPDDPAHDPESDEYEGAATCTENTTFLGVDDMGDRWHEP